MFLTSVTDMHCSSRVLNFDPTVQRWIDAASLLKGSPLQYTRFSNGFFMDYWGMPHAKTHLSPFPWAIDVFNKTAALPGDGEAIISLTHTVDLARFVVKMLEVDEWPEFSIVVGEDITFNDFLRLVERVRGECGHHVSLRGVEDGVKQDEPQRTDAVYRIQVRVQVRHHGRPGTRPSDPVPQPGHERRGRQ